MDRIKSLNLEKQIKNKEIGGFKVLEFLNNGKSAAVFRAEKNHKNYALKVFDNELIERFGHEIQSKRIEQEISLKNHSFDGLVKIYEGGNTIVDGETYYFLVMEFITGMNLKDYIKEKEYNQDFIIRVVQTLYDTTSQLLNTAGIAHRDIKPENIMVNDDEEIILMDLGVLKLIGVKSFTDGEEKAFVGTLRYAAPEFLLRNEEDSINGWNALNIYQIGATLHDLIMKKELFAEVNPYSNLVIAIKDDNPLITNTIYSFELLQLARDMMTKDWKERIGLINKSRLDKVLSKKNNSSDLFNTKIDKILKKRVKYLSSFDEMDKFKRTEEELKEKCQIIGGDLKNAITEIFQIIDKTDVCNEIIMSDSFLFSNDYFKSNELFQNFAFELKGDLKIGYPRSLIFLIRVYNNSEKHVKINGIAMFESDSRHGSISKPLYLFTPLDKESRMLKNIANRSGPPVVNFCFDTISLFDGIAEFDDSFNNHLVLQILHIIDKSLESVEEVVKSRIEDQMNVVKNGRLNRTPKGMIREIILVNSL